MRQKHRILAGLLGLLLLLGSLPAGAALATEAPAPYTEEEPGYEEDPSYEEPEPDPDPPIEEQPTDPPYTEPTEPPVSDEPGWEEEPTPEPEPEYTDPPAYSEPTEEPWYEEPTPEPDPTEDPMLGWLEEPTPTPEPTATPRPRASSTPRASATPRASLDRPKVTPHPAVSGTEEEEDDTSSGPDYRTFARLNQRNNSMSITLFYGGVGCIVIGAAGLITLLVLFLRNRRVDQRDHLIEEIELAESRPPTPQNYPPATRPATAGQQPRQPKAPVQPAAPVSQPAPTPKQPGAEPIVPESASLYTEEFTLPEIPPVQQPAQRPQAPAAPQQPAQPAAPTRPADPEKQFDTDEILREVLRQANDNKDDR